MFEAALKSEFGWDEPKRKVDRLLAANNPALAERFNDYWDANNVLKHGSGRSLDRLLSRENKLEFSVRSEDQPFFEEGVVNEIHSHIDITNSFVESCASIITQVAEAIRLGQNP